MGDYTHFNCELTNMVMIHDVIQDKVLVMNREKSWKGYAFPGGHVEPSEGFMQSAKREILEETGLTVYNLRFCGIIHWENRDNSSKYIVFLYKTEDFSGDLTASDEGSLQWISLSELPNLPCSSNFDKYVNLFFKNTTGELYLQTGGNLPDREISLYE